MNDDHRPARLDRTQGFLCNPLQLRIVHSVNNRPSRRFAPDRIGRIRDDVTESRRCIIEIIIAGIRVIRIGDSRSTTPRTHQYIPRLAAGKRATFGRANLQSRREIMISLRSVDVAARILDRIDPFCPESRNGMFDRRLARRAPPRTGDPDVSTADRPANSGPPMKFRQQFP